MDCFPPDTLADTPAAVGLVFTMDKMEFLGQGELPQRRRPPASMVYYVKHGPAEIHQENSSDRAENFGFGPGGVSTQAVFENPVTRNLTVRRTTSGGPEQENKVFHRAPLFWSA